MREVWPETFVEDNNLTVTISALRKVLDAGWPGESHIQTVPRRGYRFTAAVRTPARLPSMVAIADTHAKPGCGVLVGRERELRRLQLRLAEAVQGSGRTVFITGEPGIGKT